MSQYPNQPVLTKNSYFCLSIPPHSRMPFLNPFISLVLPYRTILSILNIHLHPFYSSVFFVLSPFSFHSPYLLIISLIILPSLSLPFSIKISLPHLISLNISSSSSQNYQCPFIIILYFIVTFISFRFFFLTISFNLHILSIL